MSCRPNLVTAVPVSKPLACGLSFSSHHQNKVVASIRKKSMRICSLGVITVNIHWRSNAVSVGAAEAPPPATQLISMD
jgi:hypothetical protein